MNQKLKTKELYNNSSDIIVSYDSDGQPYSYYFSDKWIIWSLNFNISFSMLTGNFKSSAKEIVYNILNKTTLNSQKSAIENLLSGAAIFERCITACGGSDFGFINNDHNYRLFLEEAKKRNLKYKTWKNHLIFVTHAQNEGIITRKIDNFEKLSIYLAPHGDTFSQSVCLPEKIASAYYSEALNFVEKLHPYRHQISASYDEYTSEYEIKMKQYSSAATRIKYALKNVKSAPASINITFDYSGAWLSKLRGACYIVIAAFTGCRDSEIKAFNIESYQEKKYAGFTVSILNGKHTKPNVGGVERQTSWVTIPSVKKAIELLWDAFGFAREKWLNRAENIQHKDERDRVLNDVNSLFLTLPYTTANTPKAGKQSLAHSLRKFVRSLDYRANKKDVKEFNFLNPTRTGELKVGDILEVHPHCFRRTFAVYLVRNKLASLLDIKYQFKHMNIAMTSWYANQANIASYLDMMIDNDLQNEIAGENKNYMTDIFYHLYNEAETLAGPEGRRIKNLRAEGDPTIYLSKEEIRKQVEEGRLSIIEHPGGYCTNPDCDRICDMTVCQYKIVTFEKAKSLITVRDKLIIKYNEIYSSGIDIPNIMSKIYYEIRSIEKVLSEHNLDFVAFSKEEF